MEKFDYKFENDFGLHARPAGVLVKTAKNFESNITVVKGDGNRASAKGLFALLGLKIEGGDTVSVEAEGEDEAEAIESIKCLFENNFKNPENDINVNAEGKDEKKAIESPKGLSENNFKNFKNDVTESEA